jgi:CheY-specific phosphatase CheX
MKFQDPELSNAVRTAVRSTLENMLFVEAESSDEPAVSVRVPMMHSQLDVHDPLQCQVTVQTSGALASRLAQELHGLSDEECSEQLALDTLGELLNTVAGLIFSELDEELPIRMGLPRTREGNLEPPAAALVENFQVEDSAFSVFLRRIPQA